MLYFFTFPAWASFLCFDTTQQFRPGVADQSHISYMVTEIDKFILWTSPNMIQFGIPVVILITDLIQVNKKLIIMEKEKEK